MKRKRTNSLSGIFIFLINLAFMGVAFQATHRAVAANEPVKTDVAGVEAKRNSTVTPIIVAKDAPEVVKFAVKELQYYFRKISGEDFPILTDDGQQPGKAVYVGRSRYTEKMNLPAKFDPESFIIKAVGPNLVLAGDDQDVKGGNKDEGVLFNPETSRKGSLFAVYTLLEKEYGVRWFWPGESGEVVPHKASVVLPEKIDIHDKPALPRRCFWFCDSNGKKQDVLIWSMRQKLGFGLGTLFSFTHCWTSYMGNKLYDTHPEYYALIGGKRTKMREDKPINGGPLVCTSNPDVIALFAKKIAEIIPDDLETIISIMPNDGGVYCECPACRALDHPELYTPEETDRYGKYGKGRIMSDRIFAFVNAVAREVKKTRPHVLLGMYAYTAYRIPPKGIEKIEDNVVVGVAENFNMFNPDEVRRHKEMILGWRTKCRHLQIRDYLGITMEGLPHPAPFDVAEAFKFYVREADGGYMSQSASDFAASHLDYYLGAKLLWNPKEDVTGFLEDYYQNAYGKAGKYMRDFFELMEKHCKQCLSQSQGSFSRNQWFSPEVVRQGYEILEKAERAADNEEEKARINFVRIGLKYADKYAAFHRAIKMLDDNGLPMRWLCQGDKGFVDKTPSRDELVKMIGDARSKYDELCAFIASQSQGLAFSPDILDEWAKRYCWKDNLREYAEMFEPTNNMVVSLPVSWKFQVDPGNIGEKKGWQNPDFDDAGWQSIRIDDYLKNQGHDIEKYKQAGGTNGVAWYRLNGVQIPAERKNDTCKLRLGAVDRNCVVYLNGKLAGEHKHDFQKDPEAWKKPVEIDVSASLDRNGANNFAIKLNDMGGACGIWRNAYLIFTGR